MNKTQHAVIETNYKTFVTDSEYLSDAGRVALDGMVTNGLGAFLTESVYKELKEGVGTHSVRDVLTHFIFGVNMDTDNKFDDIPNPLDTLIHIRDSNLVEKNNDYAEITDSLQDIEDDRLFKAIALIAVTIVIRSSGKKGVTSSS